MSRALALAPLAAFLLAAPAAQAQEYRRTLVPGRPLCLAWNTREYLFRLDAAGSLLTPGATESTAIDASFDAWRALSRSCSDFVLTRGPDVVQPQVGYFRETPDANENVLTFRERSCASVVPPEDACFDDDSCANAYSCWDHGSTVIGLTTVTFSTRTGFLVDADIELNAAVEDGSGFLFTTVSSPPCDGPPSTDCIATDLQDTLTHEIGHALGLDHVENPLATMAAVAIPGETRKRIIDAGSAAGFCAAYPRGLPPTQCGEPADLGRHVLVENRGLGCQASSGPLLPAMLLLVIRRRRSRRTSPLSPLDSPASQASRGYMEV